MSGTQAISTGPRGGRPTVEATPCLRMSDLRSRWGWLRSLDLAALDGSTVRLSLDHVPEGAAFAWVRADRWPAGSRWSTSRLDVSLVGRPARFGGMTWAFRCPETGALALTLYLSPDGSRLASRAALGLGFASQVRRAPARAAARAAAIRADLGGDGLTRPAGMWRSTYARQSAELARLDAAASG